MKLKTEITLTDSEVAAAIQSYMKTMGWEIDGPVTFTTETVSGGDIKGEPSWEKFNGCKFVVEEWDNPRIKKK